MTARAPLSHHLGLFRYWESKRRGNAIPGRPDIDPTEIPRLLPHIALIDTLHGVYRWRLMGSHIVDDFGCDLTGQPFGENVAPARFVGAMTATFDQVLDESEPVFEESVYMTATHRTHAVSRLVLPLAADARGPAMVLLSRITRRRPLDRPANYLTGASGQIGASFRISTLEDLERRIMAWEDGAILPAPPRIEPPPMVFVGNLWGAGLPSIFSTGSAKAALPAPLSPENLSRFDLTDGHT